MNHTAVRPPDLYIYVRLFRGQTEKKDQENLGRGGGQVVSMLAFYSDNPSSNPAEVYNFSVKLLLKRTKINKKEAGVGPLEKKVSPTLWS